MTEPFANLDADIIDEQIEQILHTFPEQQASEDARCLQDLQYLYSKEQILMHAKERLMLTNQPEQAAEATDAARREHNTIASQPHTPSRRKTFSRSKIAAMLAAAVLLIGALIGTTRFFSSYKQHAPGQSQHGSTVTPTTTPTSTILFSDSLSQNIHNFITNNHEFFKDAAYHIMDPGNNSVAVVVPQDFQETTLSYQITMEEIKGDNISPNNTFGMILRYREQTVKGYKVDTFYTFEIRNENGASQYNFYKYDSSQNDPWTQLWHADTGKEFHGGYGSKAANTVKVFADSSSFTFYVNGQQVGTTKDSSLPSGEMGMIVNLKGTEVAFSNILVTRP